MGISYAIDTHEVQMWCYKIRPTKLMQNYWSDNIIGTPIYVVLESFIICFVKKRNLTEINLQIKGNMYCIVHFNLETPKTRSDPIIYQIFKLVIDLGMRNWFLKLLNSNSKIRKINRACQKYHQFWRWSAYSVMFHAILVMCYLEKYIWLLSQCKKNRAFIHLNLICVQCKQCGRCIQCIEFNNSIFLLWELIYGSTLGSVTKLLQNNWISPCLEPLAIS